jgi:putative ABC transport system permease protein
MRNVPYDASFVVSEDSYPAGGFDILAFMRQREVNLDDFAKSYVAVRYYGGEENHFRIENVAGETASIIADLYYVKLSDYNKATGLQGIAPITLGSGEYAVDNGAANDDLMKIIKPQIAGKVLRVGGVELRPNPEKIFAHSLEVGSYINSNLIIVVPDNLLSAAPAKRDLLHIMYKQNDERGEKLAASNLEKVSDSGIGLYIRSQTKASVVERSNSNATTIAYLAVYLGVIFLVASAAILAITQLSEASDNVKRYKLLHKIGTEDRMINRAIFSQTLIYFCVPLALALVHSVVGIGVATNMIGLQFHGDILSSSIITALIILAIYGGYFLATYRGSKSMVAREYGRRDAEN